MLTRWEYSVESEAERLLHCAHQIAVGFYHINNFIVLPYITKVNSVNLVTFPDLAYKQIPGFWNEVKPINIQTLPIKNVSKDLVKNTVALLKNAKLEKPDFEKVRLQWTKAEKEVLTEIYRIIPSVKNKIKKIVIHPTAFGTSASFNLMEKDGLIEIYLRQDKSIKSIAEAIITSVTRKEIYNDLSGMWQESEIISDWLVMKSSIAKVLNKYDDGTTYVPTIKGVRIKEQARLIAESNEFYKKLGIPVEGKVFGLNGLTPEINKNPIENLNSSEKKLMKLLIQNENEVVEIDKIGDEIFGAESDYSLYAISKIVERLRKKLEANGISGSYIQTLRGKGYLLKN